VTLTDTDTTVKWDAQLTKGSVTVDLNVKPRPDGLTVTLDGKPLDGVPATGITSGDEHKLVVGAPGYVDQMFAFIASPQETKKFEVVLEKEKHRSHRGSVSNPNPPSNPVSNNPEPPAPPPAVIPAGKGKLNVGATGGWCEISIDGVSRGATPIAGLELPAGSHRVVCKPPDSPAQTARVTVSASETTRWKFTLPQ
jgi:serine/threonine-protein kinase